MNKVFFGDARESLRAMAVAGVIVQTCVTSPPYYGLRDYGHEGQIGLEETPEQYIAKLVDVFRAVREVLADNGTLWVNIGDTYAAKRGAQRSPTNTRNKAGHVAGAVVPAEIKPKDMIGIPWMLAFALRADGWYLRQDIIWHKPNPMPESVTDRCTKAHEYVFLLSKGPRYFYDHEAVKEAAVYAPALREHIVEEGGRKQLRTDVESRHRAAIKGGQSLQASPDGMRNRRSVWSIATRPYKGAHFAVFPPALVEPCILAGSRPGDVVLDPFMGSGTTAAVAIKHGRQFAGCELNPEYKPLQDQRIAAAIEARAARRAVQLEPTPTWCKASRACASN